MPMLIREMKLSCSNIEKFIIFQETKNLKSPLCFPKRQLFLYFREQRPQQKFLMFSRNKDFLLFQEKERSPKKLLISQENFPSF